MTAKGLASPEFAPCLAESDDAAGNDGQGLTPASIGKRGQACPPSALDVVASIETRARTSERPDPWSILRQRKWPPVAGRPFWQVSSARRSARHAQRGVRSRGGRARARAAGAGALRAEGRTVAAFAVERRTVALRASERTIAAFAVERRTIAGGAKLELGTIAAFAVERRTIAAFTRSAALERVRRAAVVRALATVVAARAVVVEGRTLAAEVAAVAAEPAVAAFAVELRTIAAAWPRSPPKFGRSPPKPGRGP